MALFFKHFLEIAQRRSPVAISVRLYPMHRIYPPPPETNVVFDWELELERVRESWGESTML